MTIDQEIKHQEEISDRYARMSEYEENNGNDGIAKDCAQCAADHRQLAEWLTDYKELRNSLGAVKLNNMKEALELIRAYKAENATLREFNDKIYDVLSEQFGCPCNFSLIDEYMLKNGGCDDCGGAIPDKEFWSRYIQTKLIGGRTDEEP